MRLKTSVGRDKVAVRKVAQAQVSTTSSTGRDADHAVDDPLDNRHHLPYGLACVLFSLRTPSFNASAMLEKPRRFFRRCTCPQPTARAPLLKAPLSGVIGWA